jgi:hypothetical protein
MGTLKRHVLLGKLPFSELGATEGNENNQSNEAGVNIKSNAVK